jgi:hypothetical protein
MQGETRSMLERDGLLPRAGDVARAQDIRSGQAMLGVGRADASSALAWLSVGGWSRSEQLQAHTLRWLDPMRRARHEVEGAAEHWARSVAVWSDSPAALDPASVAWARLAVIRRARVLALGAFDLAAGDEAAATLIRHRDALLGILEDPAEHLLHLDALQTLFVLSMIPAAAVDDYAALCRSAARAAVDSTGFAHTNGWGELEDVRRRWLEWTSAMREEGVSVDDVLAHVGNLDVYIHAQQPDGRWPGFGDEEARPPAALEADPRYLYVQLGGARGYSPSTLTSRSELGLVTARSGWGETEKDLVDEIYWSALFGRSTRGREHQDLGRLTYYANGVEWLVDPPSTALRAAHHHSGMAVEGRDARTYASADIVHERHDDVLDEVTLSCKTFLPVQWQRQLVFARTGNYLVVSDVLRASNDFTATQQWMINPDAHVQVEGSRAFLTIGDSTCCITTGAPAGTELSLEEIRDPAGSRAAWRLWFRSSGASMRLVTVIAPVLDRDGFVASRLPVPGNEFALRVRDRGLDEVILVTRERAALVGTDVSVLDAVDEVLQRAAIGEISEEEALEQRLATRAAIEETKAAIWADASPARRAAALDSLVAFAHERKIAMRDHGLAAAMIDVAGDDLRSRLEGVSVVSNHRRSPLINWQREPFVHPYYKVPVVTSRSSREVLEPPASRWIHSVDLGQIVPSAYVADEPGDILTVYFHGATDRGRLSTPRYERLRSFAELGLGPLLFFSDPGLDLDSRMILSWFIGTEARDQHAEIANMIRMHAARTGVEKVLLVGNSGGAFAALQVSAYLPGSKVVAFNPQIQVKHYVPRIADTAMWNLFGETDRYAERPDAHRIDVIEKFSLVDFDRDVVLIQNTGDDHHFNDHFIPFRDAFAKSPHPELLECQTPDLGAGHRVPPPDQYIATVRASAAAFLAKGWGPVGSWEPSASSIVPGTERR